MDDGNKINSITNSILPCIGNTPLINLSGFCRSRGLSANILGKAEMFNPFGSVKDRVAYQMIVDAEKSGLLKRNCGNVIIEATSGSTGIALSAIGRMFGYKVVIVMPENMSKERITLMRAYGAEVVLTPAQLLMNGSITVAEQLHKDTPDSFVPHQFSNPSNPQAHYLTTGEEIWKQTAGSVDCLVAGIGTGGTITGTARRLLEHNPKIKVYGVEPLSSPFITKGVAGRHAISGIGAGFLPEILDLSLIDEVITVSDSDALSTTRSLAQSESILAGVSSGAALFAAAQIASRQGNEGKNVVAILPDGGERYMSTGLFE